MLCSELRNRFCACWEPLLLFIRPLRPQGHFQKVACSARSQFRGSQIKGPLAGGQRATGVRFGTESSIRPGTANAVNNEEQTLAKKRKVGNGKRSYRKALAEATTHGHAKYRGQMLTVKQDFVPYSGRPPRAYAHDRLRCVSWNSSGFSAELNADFFKWLEVAGNVGFFSVQETHWGLSSDWSTDSWHLVHSTTGHYRSGGILFGMRANLVQRESVKWREIVEGRLIQVRFVYKKQQFDVISIYQHAMTFSSNEQKSETMKRRKLLWDSLAKLLDQLPIRSSVVLLGDFNTTLEPSKKIAGYGIKLGGQQKDVVADRHTLMEILRKHGLCALNTWGSVQTSYEHPQGSSSIDYICIRQSLSDGRAKQCATVEAPIAAWRTSGHKPVVADIPTNWRPWCIKPDYKNPRCSIGPMPSLETVATEQLPSLDRLNGALRQHCEIQTARVAKPPLKDLGVEIQQLWSLRSVHRRKGQIGILLADCFRALSQYAAMQAAHRKLRRAARQRKREQTLALLRDAEAAARVNDSRKLFQYVRLLSPKLSSKRIHLRGSKGELLAPTQECTLLAEYARELFKGRAFTDYKLSPLPNEWFEPAAWVRAFSKMKNHKAVPLQSSSVATWKEHALTVAPALSAIATQHLCSERVELPSNWCKAQLIWIAKPSKPASSPENLRSLGLMSPDTKAFLLVLKERADTFVQDKMQRYPQFAYRHGTSTYDPILRASSHCHKVRSILENHKGDLTSKILNRSEAELKGGIMCSLDLSKAFDRIDHGVLFEALLSTGMPNCLASILIEIHRCTDLSILHGGREEHVKMTRGLRQGCPIAPMLYSAWVCHLCSELDAEIAPNFTSEHMSIFADDKHLFWDVHSKQQLHKAVNQLSHVIKLLLKRNMQVSFSKSSVVYALRGRSAEEMVGRYTQWHKGERCFLLRIKGDIIRLPLHDRITYLGVVLSYAAFEMQSAKHRVDKATKSFGMLSKTLRVNGALSRAQRIRIYRACVWTSLAYGLPSVGFTAGSLKLVTSTVFVQLRKVLRMHEKGTTQKQVLHAACLDAQTLLIEHVESLKRSVYARSSLVGHEYVEVEKQRIDQVLQQLHTFANQDSRGALHAVVSDQVPHAECPVCGQEFAGDYGLQMHIKAKHPNLNQVSKLDFVRSKHSLFGAPFCRFCRCKCYNWQALEKHISEGGCSRIKTAFSKGVSADELLLTVEADEKLNPPTPPDAMLDNAPVMLHSGHAVLTCPLHQVHRHPDAFEQLKYQCGLCGQRMRDPITLKTHWRITHPAAWSVVHKDAESTAKSMRAIFTSPCTFCGVTNNNVGAHATKCPTFFQVAALRKLQCLGTDSNELEGVKKQRLRQHERVPEYKQWSLATTPLGKAFNTSQVSNWRQSKEREFSVADVKKVEGRQAQHTAPGEAAPSMRPVQATSTPTKATTDIRNYLTRQPNADAGEANNTVGNRPRNLPWTCTLRLRNPHSLFYVNSSITAILHMLQFDGQDFGRLEFLRQACVASCSTDSLLSLTSNLMFRSILPRWSYDAVQRDAGEFAMLLLDSLNMLQCDWRLQDARDATLPPLERGGTPIMMPLLNSDCTLQDVIDAWGQPENAKVRFITRRETHLIVQLDRYCEGSKVFTAVDFEAPVRIPVRQEAQNEQVSYRVVSAVFHTGRSVLSGHYQALLRVGHSWQLCDDNASAVPLSISPHVRRNVYLLMLTSYVQ